MALPIFLSSSNNFYIHSLLNRLQPFLIIHKHKTYLNTLHAETTSKKLNKRAYTGTLLSSLSRANFTRSERNIFFKPIIVVNVALFVLNFLNLPQGDILTKAEKHFETLKDTSLLLPIGKTG